MRRYVRVGLVGAGAIAELAHLPSLVVEPDVRVVGVVTSTPDTAARVVARWPIERAYDSVDVMVERAHLDAMFVLTPMETHSDFVALGLKAGIDVFCEKPLATSLIDARRLVALSRQTGRILMVGYNRRFAPAYVRARAAFRGTNPTFCIASKSRPSAEFRGSLENAIHMVDVLRWFCGVPVQVEAHALARDRWSEDGIAALVRFETGAIGVLVAPRQAGEPDERLDAYGQSQTVRVTAPGAVSTTRDGLTTSVDTSREVPLIETMGFAGEVRNFLESIETRQDPVCSGEEALATQDLMDRILAAADLPRQDPISSGALG